MHAVPLAIELRILESDRSLTKINFVVFSFSSLDKSPQQSFTFKKKSYNFKQLVRLQILTVIDLIDFFKIFSIFELLSF